MNDHDSGIAPSSVILGRILLSGNRWNIDVRNQQVWMLLDICNKILITINIAVFKLDLYDINKLQIY